MRTLRTLVVLSSLVAAFLPAGVAVAQATDTREHSTQPRNRWTFGGRLMFDSAIGDTSSLGGTRSHEVRRARLSVRGRLTDTLTVRTSIEFAFGNPVLREGWLGYTGIRDTRIRAGQILKPAGLEQLTSSNYLTFMERALPTVLAPGYGLGTDIRRAGRSWSLTAGAFAGSVDNPRSELGIAGRLTLAPVAHRRRSVHLGTSLRYAAVGDRRLRFGARPETHLLDHPLLSTHSIRHVDRRSGLGAEGAVVRGPVSLQAEYLMTRLTRTGGRASLTFHGWYAATSWILTGEARRYRARSGTFGALRPRGRWGAVEVAARVSALDLEDAGIHGGTGRVVTLGANWYLRDSLRVMVNHSWMRGERSNRILQARIHFFLRP